MSNLEKAKQALIAADQAGDYQAARQLALFIQEQESAKPTGIMDKLTKREAEIQSLKEQSQTDQITPFESVYRQGGQVMGAGIDLAGAAVGGLLSGANDLMQGVPGELLSRGAQTFGKLPSFGGGTIGERVPEEARQLGQLYGGFKEENPRTAGMVEATGNYLGFGVPVGKGAIQKTGEEIYKSGARKQLSELEQLAMPKATKKVREAAQAEDRLKQTIFADTINPTDIEIRAAEIINELPEFTGLKGAVPKKLSTKGRLVRKEAINRAQKLQKDLLKYDNIRFKENYIKDSLIEGVKKDLIDDPNFWTTGGDFKTQVNNYVEKMSSLIDQNPKTLAGINNARIEFDKWARSKTPNVFDEGAATNIRQATKSVRNNINDFIASQVPDEQVRQKLYDSHSLFNAAENISDKVASQADTALKRVMISLEDAIPFKTGEMKLGATLGAGTGALMATDAAIVGGIIYLGGKALNRAQSRKFIGKLLSQDAVVLDLATKDALQEYLSELQAADMGE